MPRREGELMAFGRLPFATRVEGALPAVGVAPLAEIVRVVVVEPFFIIQFSWLCVW